MTIFDWIMCGAAVGLCIATVVMMTMALKIVYKMTEAGPETEIKEAEPTKGLRVGIYVAEKDRLEQANNLARCLCATHLTFDNSNAQLSKVIETYSGCIYDFSDGLRIETLVARESSRGKRFNYLYIDKAISDNCILHVLLPQVISNIDAPEEKVNDGWEFFDANSVEQNKKEWRNGEWK